MRIAIGAIISKPITSHPLGGTEQFTYTLVEGLVKRGHHVTLYCAKGSKTPAQTHRYIVEPEKTNGEISSLHPIYPYTLYQTRLMLQDIRQHTFDIVHINFLKTFLFSYFADQIPIPIIYTMHRDFMQHQQLYDAYRILGFHQNEHFVFVSHSARNTSLLHHNTHVIYNGISIEDFPLYAKSGQSYFLWMSRVDPLKGPVDAAIAAQKTGVSLILSGIIDRPQYQSYYDTGIKPLLSDTVRFEEAAGSVRRKELYQHAKAYLFPIQWEEPFGLVLIESMATGTPIIAYGRGAIPEIVQDGISGFIINPSESDMRGDWIIKQSGIEGLAEAIQKVNGLSTEEYTRMRQASRYRAEQFSTTRMINDYETLYRHLVSHKS